MLIGIGVIVVVGGVGLVMSGSFSKLAEDRLEGLTGGKSKRTIQQLLPMWTFRAMSRL